MEKRIMLIGVVLAGLLVGAAPFALAADKGTDYSMARMATLMQNFQGSLNKILDSQEGLNTRLAENTSRMDTQDRMLTAQFSDYNYLFGRLSYWIQMDKVDISALYDVTDSIRPTTRSKMGHMDDSAESIRMGWNPDGKKNRFIIHDSDVTVQSVITITTDGDEELSSDCHVGKLYTTKYEEGFSVICPQGIAEKTNLNYVIVNPFE